MPPADLPAASPGAAEVAMAAVTAALLIDPDDGLRILRDAQSEPFGHAVPAALLGAIYGAWHRLCAETGVDVAESWRKVAVDVATHLHGEEPHRA